MQFQDLFEEFNTQGKLVLTESTSLFKDIPWSKHQSFEGVELKHILSSQQSKGQFSFHLVRIVPNKKIGLHSHQEQLESHEVIAGDGLCLNNKQELIYEAGVISIFPKAVEHEVRAGANGLYLFAKFFPALV